MWRWQSRGGVADELDVGIVSVWDVNGEWGLNGVIKFECSNI